MPEVVDEVVLKVVDEAVLKVVDEAVPEVVDEAVSEVVDEALHGFGDRTGNAEIVRLPFKHKSIAPRGERKVVLGAKQQHLRVIVQRRHP